MPADPSELSNSEGAQEQTMAAPAIGAVVAGLVMARLGTVKRQGLIVILSVAVFGAATIAFG